MKELSELPSPEVIEAEAAAWITQLDSDRVPTESDLAVFREWVNRSPQHRVEVERLAVIWGDLNMLTELIERDPATSQSSKDLPSSGFATTPWSWATYPALASIVLLAGLFIGYSVIWDQKESPEQFPSSHHTSVGEQRLVTLQDGSTILMNTDTHIETRYSGDNRKIHLYKGEAHFDVYHDPARPFEVYARNGVIEAVGTAFTVSLERSEVEVTVTEGKVRLTKKAVNPPSDSNLSNGNDEALTEAGQDSFLEVTILEPGQSVLYGERQATPVTEPDKQKLDSKLAWHKGMLSFTGEPLEKVVEEVSRYTHISIVIADPTIRELRIGGQFRVDDIDELFSALETVFGIRVVHVDEDVVKLLANKG